MRRLALVLLLLAPSAVSAQKFDSLAATPPMGWNSWNHFACDVNEELIRSTAEAMVSSGMRDAGYQYVNIDDCWHGERDEMGFIQPHAERFPSGMKALADYVHSLGLKLGIYSDAGWKTCAGKPGSRGYEYQDALTYAEWGIDYLKYDWCNTEKLNAEGAYLTMRDALFAAGRPIVFSICEWGDNDPWEWAPESGHLWRTTGDIINCFDCEIGHGDVVVLGSHENPRSSRRGCASTRRTRALERSRHDGGRQRHERRARTGRTSRCGRCSRRRSLPATICGRCPTRRPPSSPMRR